MRELSVPDLFGVGWRTPLAAGILAHLDRIDVVEALADDWADAPARDRRALRTLAAQVPVVLHGVGMGLASHTPTPSRRLDAMARLVDLVAPAFWSEHLAFVRAGDVEIGHLAAPPRSTASIEALSENVARATRAVGSPPVLENVATLLEPPGSDRSESAWLRDAQRATGADLLLDLHNLYANARNTGTDAGAALDALPLDRVRAVHLAGGRWIHPRDGSPPRLLDDHLHDAPAPVFALLERLGAEAPPGLTVILERDGRFAGVEPLLVELDRARHALAAGRARRRAGAPAA